MIVFDASVPHQLGLWPGDIWVTVSPEQVKQQKKKNNFFEDLSGESTKEVMNFLARLWRLSLSLKGQLVWLTCYCTSVARNFLLEFMLKT